ncbi:hypothetical protein LZD49_26230 [Dyadobacter sp. CY261]|uniref:hypothetical protein n=1 Tax=Dyadobacter sp. CY261 TaxID=2907203 RepID=UPI001F2D029C|nr:hypothetical protein [Dyadobacter sp. CY261]MCF0074007.1 hypothetical protein [Dyadobacter sp. CY261]
MDVLERIEQHMSQNAAFMQSLNSSLIGMHPKPEQLPDIFINASEVQRILSVSAPTVIMWTRYGIIRHHDNPQCRANKFLLREILWLKKQKYTFLTPAEIKSLISRRSSELS